MKGKIVLIPFPFTDLTTTKLRPALVLFEGKQDVVAAFISSRTPQIPGPTEIIVNETHPEFKLTGLKASSVIRLDKIATISKDLILGEIGEISDKLKKETNIKLFQAYKFTTQ
ncbi:MAG: type II toxin-antitoxin system PemK/MazF family toxin [Candidatus Bathyarchaeia archaeon]